MANCPQSGTTGKRVSRVTLDSLVLAEHRSYVGSAEAWHYCPDPDCGVVYFDAEGNTLEKSALSVRVGVKESDPPRPICYCFGHTFEEIEAEVAATGTSGVPDSITEKCRQGLHDCERKNPQGSCCLGSVRAALKEAQASRARSTAPDEDCCASPAQRPERRSVGRLAAGGAVFSAILSSACCWLPLVLLAFGASAAGVSGFFERYRPLFLVASAVLLALGFYLVYVRKPACAPGEACAVPSPRITRINRAMLWIATAFVAAFALFPNYVGVLLGTGHAREAASADATFDLEFAVEGMTCEACAETLGSKLASLPGVSAAEVSYSAGRARLHFDSPQARPTDQAIAGAVSAAGYHAVLP